MAKVILKYEAAVLKEIPLQKATMTIGRTPGNDLVIDNLAVSGLHARLVLEEDHFLVEDMNSLNGTFLNGQRIRKSQLSDGDEILIGKHTLIFRGEGAIPKADSTMDRTQPIKQMDATVVLDTKKRREFLAKATSIATEGVSQSVQEKIGTLTVLDGKTDQNEYILTGKLCVIGKSDMATVKLKGWFAPKVAAIINRHEGKYTISPSDKAGAAKINAQTLTAPHDLHEGDTIEVSGIKMQFFFRE
ncbi:MAG: FHA domain-containing protein [Acidobacteria bacterium]|nr:FHA domain-containing protein [Acidobacteriota bacterium]